MTKVFPETFLILPSGSGVSLKRRLRLYSSRPMFDIIPAMGRLRVKKKESVIPFRDTLAYRLLLATGSVFLFLVTVYFLMKYVGSGNNIGMIVSAFSAVMAGISVFYNLGQVRNARVSPAALKRAKRR